MNANRGFTLEQGDFEYQRASTNGRTQEKILVKQAQSGSEMPKFGVRNARQEANKEIRKPRRIRRFTEECRGDVQTLTGQIYKKRSMPSLRPKRRNHEGLNLITNNFKRSDQLVALLIFYVYFHLKNIIFTATIAGRINDALKTQVFNSRLSRNNKQSFLYLCVE